MLKRSCACGELHPVRTRCPTSVQQTERNRRRGSATARGYGTDWQKLSAMVIARDRGLCQLRLAVCVTRATTADHITPKSAGGTDDPGNLQAACRPCNSAKRDRLV